jgi:hypothetical protein
MSCPLCECSFGHGNHFINDHQPTENVIAVTVCGEDLELSLREARQLAMEILVATYRKDY